LAVFYVFQNNATGGVDGHYYLQHFEVQPAISAGVTPGWAELQAQLEPVFTVRMLFLSNNQQLQSTEQNSENSCQQGIFLINNLNHEGRVTAPLSWL